MINKMYKKSKLISTVVLLSLLSGNLFADTVRLACYYDSHRYDNNTDEIDMEKNEVLSFDAEYPISMIGSPSNSKCTVTSSKIYCRGQAYSG